MTLHSVEKCLPENKVLRALAEKFLILKMLHHWPDVFSTSHASLLAIATTTECRGVRRLEREDLERIVDVLHRRFVECVEETRGGRVEMWNGEATPGGNEDFDKKSASMAEKKKTLNTRFDAMGVEIANRKSKRIEKVKDLEEKKNLDSKKMNFGKMRKMETTKREKIEEDSSLERNLHSNIVRLRFASESDEGQRKTQSVSSRKIRSRENQRVGRTKSQVTTSSAPPNPVTPATPPASLNSSVAPLACSVCSFSFPDKTKLWKHNWRVHNRKLSHACATCDRRFYTRHDLKTHERTHSSERPFVCQDCGASYRWRSSLNAHRRSHTEQIYRCRICGRTCKTARTLKSHESVHEEKISKNSKKYFLIVRESTASAASKIHRCPTCSAAFAFKNSLAYHLARVHRPHSCGVCGKAFGARQKLAQHAARAHGVDEGGKELRCRVCERRYSSSKALRIHEATHDGKSGEGRLEEQEEGARVRTRPVTTAQERTSPIVDSNARSALDSEIGIERSADRLNREKLERESVREKVDRPTGEFVPPSRLMTTSIANSVTKKPIVVPSNLNPLPTTPVPLPTTALHVPTTTATIPLPTAAIPVHNFLAFTIPVLNVNAAAGASSVSAVPRMLLPNDAASAVSLAPVVLLKPASSMGGAVSIDARNSTVKS